MKAAKTETDSTLVQCAITGDREAFTRLVERYRAAVVAVAAAHLRNDVEAAHDVAQEAFIHAYLRLSHLRDPERFGAWLRRITVNLCADFQRRGGKESGPVSLTDDLPAPISLSPERLATHLRVRAALDTLSPKTRLTVLLFHLSGYSHAEIATFLDIPVNTVRSRLRLARQKLREEILAMMEEERAANRPDPEWTRRTVEEAVKRGHAAMKAPGPERETAWTHFDAALETLRRSDPLTEEELELKQDILLHAGSAHRAAQDRSASLARWEEALQLAEARGDQRAQAQALELLAVLESEASFRGPMPTTARERYEKAAALYREMGDVNNEGATLLWLGSELLNHSDFDAGESCLEKAAARAEAAGKWWLVCALRAHLDLLTDVGQERYPRLPLRHTACHTIRFEGDRAYFHADYGGTLTQWPDGIAGEIKARLGTLGALDQFARTGLLLDGLTPGRTWSGWHKPAHLPVTATTTILSDGEHVETPAGTFDNCLLLEQVTTRAGEAPEPLQRTIRDLCGVRRAYLAPSVGLVRLEIDTENASGVVHWLTEYAVDATSDIGDGVARYLPMVAGNTWTYRPANIPAGYRGKEFYRVRGLDHRNCWCLERYAWVGPADS